MTKRVLIVGGGVTGLSAAHAILDEASRRGVTVDVTLLERSTRLGGNIVTHREAGFVVDGGPDSWVANKPHATTLAKKLGLEADLMPTREEARRVYVAWDGSLHALPEGLVLSIPTRIRPILESHLFSWGGKARMGLEPFVAPRKWEGDEDESIGDFIARRLGPEVRDRLASPLLGGIFAGDAAKISIRATFPQFVEAEKKHGSLIKAMRAARAAAAEAAKASGQGGSKAPPSAFLSLRGGLGTLIDALEVALEGRITIRRGADVLSLIEHAEDAQIGEPRYEVRLASGGALRADAVFFGAPAHAVARALDTVDRDAAQVLDSFRYVSTATVFVGFHRKDIAHPLDAVGFIVPRASGRPILAGTWVSSKWQSRAPESEVLMRVFFGGAWGEEVLKNDDDGLVAIALEQFRDLMKLDAKPYFAKVFRFNRSNPQPEVGHLGKMRALRERLARHPGLHVAGSGYDGVGIPDCVRQAEEAAARIVEGLSA